MTIPLFQVDAFSDRPFGGNPAAVCILDHFPEDDWLRSLAAEMNLSETAFLVPQGEGYQLRWFTPVAEVDLCGHATLAAAHILWSEGYIPATAIARFMTRTGGLSACNNQGWIEMNFPSQPVTDIRSEGDRQRLEQMFTGSILFVGAAGPDYFVEIERDQDLIQFKPDLATMAQLSCRGIIFTALSRDSNYDFISRFFAPQLGIPEDPVTGSAHCSLALYWGKRLGKTKLVAYQASRRGGEVHVRYHPERVYISGQAMTIFRGNLVKSNFAHIF